MKYFTFLIIALFTIPVFSQVGIGTTNPQTSLDIEAANPLGSVSAKDGILVPRVTDLEIDGSVNGQLIFLNSDWTDDNGTTGNTNDDQLFKLGFHYWNATTTMWTAIDTTVEPWYKANTTDVATANDDNIYTLGQVGIGTNNPLGALHITTENSRDVLFLRFIDGLDDDLDLDLFRSLGSVASPALLPNNTRIGGLRGQALTNASTYAFRPSAEIYFESDGASSSNSSAGKIKFATTSTGSTSTVDRMTIRQDGNVGIGTIDPLDKLHINNGSLRITDGTQAAGKVLTSDANGKATWQNATSGSAGWQLNGNTATATNFLGTTNAQPLNFKVENIDVGSIKTNSSLNLGRASSSNGDRSSAFGFESNAGGAESVALGRQANSSGARSSALGFESKANGDESTAIGRGAEASEPRSTALGFESTATATDATALGRNASSTASRATAVGFNSVARATDAVAVGREATASGTLTTSIGPNSSATAGEASAFGKGATAQGPSSTAIGRDSRAQGSNASSFGKQAQATANNATAIGPNANASAINATAIGYNATATQANSVILGNNANVGIGTPMPDTKLHVAGSVKIVDGTQGAGKVLTSDATGEASWQANPGVTQGDVKNGFQYTDHNGWYLLNGRAINTLPANAQTAAAALGFSANLPNATNRVLKARNGGETMGSQVGSNSITLAANNIPQLSGTGTTTTNGQHTHQYNGVRRINDGDDSRNDGQPVVDNTLNTSAAGNHNHSVTITVGNASPTAINNTPASIVTNVFVYLGN